MQADNLKVSSKISYNQELKYELTEISETIRPFLYTADKLLSKWKMVVKGRFQGWGDLLWVQQISGCDQNLIIIMKPER